MASRPWARRSAGGWAGRGSRARQLVAGVVCHGGRCAGGRQELHGEEAGAIPEQLGKAQAEWVLALVEDDGCGEEEAGEAVVINPVDATLCYTITFDRRDSEMEWSWSRPWTSERGGRAWASQPSQRGPRFIDPAYNRAVRPLLLFFPFFFLARSSSSSSCASLPRSRRYWP